MSKIKAVDLKEKAAAHIDIKDGVAVFERDKLVGELLEAVDAKESDLKAAYDKTATVANAITMAFGEKAIDYLKENKKVESVSLTTKVGHENISVVSRRKSESQNPRNREETIVSHGNVTLRRTLVNGGSELKGIKEHLKAIGAKTLA